MMLKAMAYGNDGKQFLILGLSRGNCERLLANQPIQIKGSDVSIPVDILIFAGETEAAMARELESFIGPNTDVTFGPRTTDA